MNAIVGHLLSWPVFGVVAVVVFRRQLALLIHRITSYEGLGQKVTFGQELAKIEEQVDALASSQPQDLPSSAGEQLSVTKEEDQYTVLAAQAPAGAILQAWIRVEKALALVAETSGDASENKNRSYKVLGGRPLTPSPAQLVRELAERRLVPTAVIRAIDGLRRLRNEVAHGVHDPTAGEAITYVITAREVWEILERLASFAKTEDGIGEAGTPAA